MKWSQKEKELLISYAFASDEETEQANVENARHMMYFEGNHPELKERTIWACISMYQKLKIKPK